MNDCGGELYCTFFRSVGTQMRPGGKANTTKHREARRSKGRLEEARGGKEKQGEARRSKGRLGEARGG